MNLRPLYLAIVLFHAASSIGLAAEPPEISFVQPPLVGGSRTLRPQHWSMFTIEVANPREEEVRVVTTTYFPNRAATQFGRELWIPPLATRRSWYPVLVPELDDPDTKSVESYSLLIDRTTEDERNIPSRSGVLHHMGLSSVTKDLPTTAIFGDPDEDDPMHAAAAMRVSRNKTTLVPGFHQPPLPPLDLLLMNLDQLVISSDRLVDDAAALLAVRRWLFSGGRLWIMLDRVDANTVRLMLGERANWDAVDDVLLDAIEITDERPVPEKQTSALRHFDDPIRMVRLLVEDVEVTHSVNGWPAAFWCRAGRGEVLLTTVEARAWYRPWTDQDDKPKDGRMRSRFVTTLPLRTLGERFLTDRYQPTRAASSPSTAALEVMTTAAIGHQVLSRSLVVCLLGGFCLCLLAAGIILSGFGRGAWMGWLGPALAVLATTIIGVAGSSSRDATPRSAAVGQFIEADPLFNELRTSGTLAMYNPTQSDQRLGSHGNGIFIPRSIAGSGTTARMIWTDLENWHWENVNLESGIQLATFSHNAIVGSAVSATATFDQEGLVGNLQAGPLNGCADAVLVTKSGTALDAQLQADNSFVGRSADIFSPGQFATDAMISEKQRQQQAVIASLIESEDWRSSGSELTLLTWVDPLPLPFDINDPERMTGNDLLAVPIRLRRPAMGTRVSIPAPLVTYRAVQRKGGSITSAYSNIDRQWLGPLARATRANLQIDLPREVLPLEVVGIDILLKIRAPQRHLRFLKGGVDDDLVLEEISSPVGDKQFRLDDAEHLQFDREGRLQIVVDVGRHPVEDDDMISKSGWQIDALSFQVDGIVREK